jgi:hypothetical protein
MVSVAFFSVPTVTLKVLSVFVVLALRRSAKVTPLCSPKVTHHHVEPVAFCK